MVVSLLERYCLVLEVHGSARERIVVGGVGPLRWVSISATNGVLSFEL